ncbi:unnamed protein product [Dovyalis caffra]|uniref:Uncharacterized protein n=1 Tax=Dovyalis caffra TaxID=77055 RepID=A0AAV1SNK4_9ROSI|nr:unnamed protein product [Dovyalis caffra]
MGFRDTGMKAGLGKTKKGPLELLEVISIFLSIENPKTNSFKPPHHLGQTLQRRRCDIMPTLFICRHVATSFCASSDNAIIIRDELS